MVGILDESLGFVLKPNEKFLAINCKEKHVIDYLSLMFLQPNANCD